MEKKPIHIVCNIDESYVKYCIVMLTSLFENNKDEVINVHLIFGKISAKGKCKIEQVIKKYGQTICFYPIGDELLKDCHIYGDKSHISLATYYRVFLCSILPKQLNKVLYLDSDLVVNGSISELWNTDINEYAVGCVEDMWSGKPDNYTRLHYDVSHSYFNAGVLLMNLDYLRKSSFEEKAIKYIQEHVAELIFNDQDVLNALLFDQKYFLPFRWNVQDGFLRRKRRIQKNSISKLELELKHPVIIHYTGSKKPWQYKSINPYKALYYYYLDKTEWKGERTKTPFTYKCKLGIKRLLVSSKITKPKYRKI